MSTVTETAGTTETATAEMSLIHWEYLDGVPGVVLVAREGGRALAIIEMCPRAGFRLTDCASGAVNSFLSLAEAQGAFLARRAGAHS